MEQQLTHAATRWEHVTLAVDRHVATLRLHSRRGGSLHWNDSAQRDLTQALRTVAADPDVWVLVITGTGQTFIGGEAVVDALAEAPPDGLRHSAAQWAAVEAADHALLEAFFAVEVPVVMAVHGRVHIHPELVLLADVVIAARDVEFRDGHLVNGYVPGDGAQIAWPTVLGPVRARTFLLLGQRIRAEEALARGVVSEVVDSRATALRRARSIADSLLPRGRETLRGARLVSVRAIRRAYAQDLEHGLAVQGLAAAAGVRPVRPDESVDHETGGHAWQSHIRTTPIV